MRFLPPREVPAAKRAIPDYPFSGQVNEFYKHPAASSYNLNKLLYDLRHDSALRRRMIENPGAVAQERNLSAREAMVIDTLLDENIDLLRNEKTHPLVEAGAHPLGTLMSIVVVQAEMRRMRKEAQAHEPVSESSGGGERGGRRLGARHRSPPGIGRRGHRDPGS